MEARERAAKWLRTMFESPTARITLITTRTGAGYDLPVPTWLQFRRDFAGVADAKDLPAPEREAWRALFTELEGFLPRRL